eukprot:TRINITY_DN1089_c0_g6_i1.p1 TRINITY_DN1089_c0_g6~~TRINITY_DN1089_c0_g6_i1.p1  ORF type:complete len:534 (+),score=208.77 TRINITY_DN1089_c0_g6_i1:60-1661(+)
MRLAYHAVPLKAAPVCRGLQARGVAVRTRAFDDDAEGGSRPSAMYRRMVRRGDIVEDEQQHEVLACLDDLHMRLVQRYRDAEARGEAAAAPLKALEGATAAAADTGGRRGFFDYFTSPGGGGASLFGSWKKAVGGGGVDGAIDAEVVAPAGGHPNARRGLYVHGGVGCGKTMLMDMFYHGLPTHRKLRIHLQAFMFKTHRAIHKLSVEKIQTRHEGSTLDLYIMELCNQYDIICFDEFQVLDAADAALLTKLFKLLFAKGVILVCTSNKSPWFFNTLGRQYSQFVALLAGSCQELVLSSTFDYRTTTGVPTQNVYLHPNSQENYRKTLELFKATAREPVEQDFTLENMGRCLRVPCRAGGLCLFHFEDLCGMSDPLSPSDYHLLANQFHTLFLFGVPVLSVMQRNEARRFITLIDEMYQHKVNVVVCAEAPRERLFSYALADDASSRAAQSKSDSHDAAVEDDDDEHDALWRFTGEEDVFAFKRVESRLAEMATDEYLLLPHLNFVPDDINIQLLTSGAPLPDSGGASRFIDI